MKVILLMALLICGCSCFEINQVLINRVGEMMTNINTKVNMTKQREAGDIIDGFKEFCKGFYGGAYELARWDIKMFTMCMNSYNDTIVDLKKFWDGFVKAFEHIDINIFHKLWVLFTNLFNRLSSHIAPCSVFVGFTLHFLDLFRHLTWEDVENAWASRSYVMRSVCSRMLFNSLFAHLVEFRIVLDIR